MTLNVNNQLTLLLDLLDEQQLDCCGSVSEFQQIERLVKSMLANNSITDNQLLSLLPDIYNYGRQGESAPSQPDHITSNKDNLHNWISAIQQTTLE
ncbi:YtzH-like family protein [Oceanobacillus massiliensis]|uniref:YtzH-like family protein n=1 Tax=Oceanobacillus massiliensis TaxID=1465765 RepID=UPI000288B4B0|nr:YtzH-like family protein [Oceanobacillus massiliensis]